MNDAGSGALTAAMRTLIGGIGYPDLCDHSAGLDVIGRLAERDLGPDVMIEDTSYNPIAIVQWLEAEPPDRRFEQIIFVSAVERGRPGGTLTAYRWNGVVPAEELVQQAVTEAVTGVIALDNTVVIGGYFRVFPETVAILEIEPIDHAFGSSLSALVSRAIDRAAELIRSIALDRAAMEALPVDGIRGRPLVRVEW